MSVMKEWRCKVHGNFEGSHPICPEMGCISLSVERVFLTPVSISQGKYARFDKGLRKTAEMLDIPNWKTARAGETAFAGRAPLGQELLWGKDVEKVMGTPFASQVQAANQPLHIAGRDPATDPYLTINRGIQVAATEMGLTGSRLPKAELTYEMRPGKVAA
jgi:hypothetical protein